MAGESTPGCIVFVPLAEDRRVRNGNGRGAQPAARALVAHGMAFRRKHHY